MRDYGCHFYELKEKEKEKKLEAKGSACFSGIRYCLKSEGGTGTIYISNYTYEETKDYINLIVEVTNQITPCEFVTIDGNKYIKFELLKTYDQSLILLNFIRNLWYSPRILPDKIYSVDFFKALKADTTSEDPLERLTKANKTALVGYNGGYSEGDHSNVFHAIKLAVKTKEQLLDFNGISKRDFLIIKI